LGGLCPALTTPIQNTVTHLPGCLSHWTLCFLLLLGQVTTNLVPNPTQIYCCTFLRSEVLKSRC
jgi:hypothetical protein